jgi:hypothetical protein
MVWDQSYLLVFTNSRKNAYACVMNSNTRIGKAVATPPGNSEKGSTQAAATTLSQTLNPKP